MTDAAYAPGLDTPGPSRARRAVAAAARAVWPVAAVLCGVVVVWYLAAFSMNLQWERDQAARAGKDVPLVEMLGATMSQKRPVVPAPHQVAEEFWKTTVEKKVTSKRSLVYHGWVTLEATLLGFAMGAAFGVALAAAIVHARSWDMSVMPWVIASQTVPIIALTPMVVGVLGGQGAPPLLIKALISTYLSFFPVTVSMVKGLRAPDHMQLDLMRTWRASSGQVFWKLRWPSSVPYLFAGLKVGAAAAMVGVIVAELPLSGGGGIGARLLAGSYYGQMAQLWAALVFASLMAAALVWSIALIERAVLIRMGMRR